MISAASSNDERALFEGPEGQIVLLYLSALAQCEPFGLTSACSLMLNIFKHEHGLANTQRRGLQGWQHLGLLSAAAAGHPGLCGLYHAWVMAASRLWGVESGFYYWQ